MGRKGRRWAPAADEILAAGKAPAPDKTPCAEVPGFPLTGWPVNGLPGKGGPAGARASDAPSPWDDVESCAEVIDRALSSMSVASRRQPATVPAPADEPPLLLSAVYLLSSDRVAEFTTVARALDGIRHGIRVDLTGPWPPYSFADVHGV